MNLVRYTDLMFVQATMFEARSVIVKLNGTIMSLVLEAESGEKGYVICYKLDENGRVVIKDDAIGSVEIAELNGKVEFFKVAP